MTGDRLPDARRERTRLFAVLAGIVALVGVAVLVEDLTYLRDVPASGQGGDAAVTRQQIAIAGVKVVRVGVLVCLAWLPSVRSSVRRFADHHLSPGWLGDTMLALGLLIAASVTSLPFAAWGSSDRLGGEWLPEWLIAHAELWVLGTLIVVAVLWSRPRWPASWHWRLALVGVVIAATIPFFADLDPLGDTRRPLPPGEVRTQITTVLSDAGNGDLRIEVGSGPGVGELGAYVTGFGPSRAIVVSEVLLALPPRQAAFIAAHELAHAERRDLVRVVLASGAGMVAVAVALRLGLARSPLERPRGPTAVVSTILAIVAVGHLLATPVANARSRAAELAADERALHLTQDPTAAVELQRWLARIGAVEPRYPRWYGALFASHPAAGDRIALATRFADERGIQIDA